MECKNCKFFKGNCGKHFIDDLGHIIYEIPDLNYEGLYDRIECFVPSEEYLKKQQENDIRTILSKYSPETITKAFEAVEKNHE